MSLRVATVSVMLGFYSSIFLTDFTLPYPFPPPDLLGLPEIQREGGFGVFRDRGEFSACDADCCRDDYWVSVSKGERLALETEGPGWLL